MQEGQGDFGVVCKSSAKRKTAYGGGLDVMIGREVVLKQSA